MSDDAAGNAFGPHEVVQVARLPDCDVHLRFHDTRVPAVYDTATTLPGRPWAFLCTTCYPRYGLGRLVLGAGQRLVLNTAAPANEPQVADRPASP